MEKMEMEREFPSACHVDRTLINKEIVKEVLEEQLKKVINDFKEVILLDE